MYATVFLVCFGVLHILKTSTDPGPYPGTAWESGTESLPASEAFGVSEPEAAPSESETVPSVREGTPSEADGLPQPEPEVQRETGYKGWEHSFSQVWTPPQEETYTPPRVILATDLHYQSAQADDGGKAFQDFVETGDGKVVQYLPELLEAFIDEVIREAPSALVLSGDITMNGERINHNELADRLSRIREAGIPVAVIPGNHDINNHHAAVYYGKEKTPAPSVDQQEFYEIYSSLGYDQALSRDPDSLSYVFPLDEKNWLLMLDSCQYDPVNLVEGRIRETTLDWAREQLEMAREQGIFVLPVAHHNLLAQSRMYTTQCAMENNSQVIDLLQEYRLPLFFSGHLHVQRIRKHKSEPGVPDEAYGIQEIITDSISIPPCQYGMITWKEDGAIEYATRSVDVSAWAAENAIDNPDLLDFETWSQHYIEKLITDQIRGVVKNLGEEVEHSMASVYAGVYIDYYAGRRIDAKGVRSSKGYIWWQRNMPDSYLLRELDAMIMDSDRDNNYFLLPERVGAVHQMEKGHLMPIH